MKRDLTCPVCATELTMEQLFAHEETRAAFARLAVISIPLGAKVLAYLQMHAPEKNRQTIACKVALLEQLLPDIERQAITRNGRDWDAPREAWSTAFETMAVQRDQGKLQLPLNGHGYLYAVLQGLADKAERSGEAAEEDRRKHRSIRAATGSKDIGSVLGALTPDDAPTSPPLQAPPPAPVPPPGTSPLVRRMREEIARKHAAQAAPPVSPTTEAPKENAHE